MADEQSLPRLPPPPPSWDAQPPSFISGSRKRIRGAQRFQDDNPQNFNSSDPAIFSSDDDPGLDNYVEGRRKKRYVGSWFQQHPASSDSTFGDSFPKPKPKMNRKLARQVDSGVFLASDGAESDDMMESLDVPVRSRLPQLDRSPVPRISSTEVELQRKVAQCLEDGNETLDFWSMGLETLSNETMAPLANFSCIPQITKDVAFEQKDPSIKIFLAQNLLTRLPGALFDLVNITSLSLRSNRLTELPPSIAKLRNLRELNVSLNRLRCLPIEFLDLVETSRKLETLILHPNPFLQPALPEVEEPEPEMKSTTIGYALQKASPDTMPYFITEHAWQSPLQISSSSGRILSKFTIPSADEDTGAVPLQTEAPDSLESSDESNPSAVPSLLEIALRSCSRSTDLPDLPHYIPDGLPLLRQLLERAASQKESGGLACSRCQKQIVVPTVECIEWRALYARRKMDNGDDPNQTVFWDQSSEKTEQTVPFLHRGCTERCRPVMRRGFRFKEFDS